MIKNYVSIAWRNLNKHRFFSLVNILGLSIGIAAFWIILLYVSNEWSYDRYNEKADRIFRVVQHGKWGNGGFDLAITSRPYAGALKTDFPEVESAVNINTEGGGTMSYQGKRLEVDDILFTQNAIFEIFSYHFIEGNSENALADPQSIVLTRSLANKIFGSAEAAINKSVLFDGNFPNKVTGVIEDVPANSHFRFSALRSLDMSQSTEWASADVFTYLLLRHPEDFKKIQAHSDDFFNKYLKSSFANIKYKMELEPLTSIHLHSHLSYEFGNNGNISYVLVFSLIGILVLGMAIINYVNLTTARASIRVKEIGIRKVIGSGRAQLMLMFFSESVLLAILSTGLAIILINTTLPYFNSISGKSMVIWEFGLQRTLVLFLAFAIITGLLSGIYPSLVLSGYQCIPAMKGQIGNQNSTVVFRKTLVTFQFVITIVMIAGSLIIYEQLHYVMHKDLGFNKSQMLSFHIRNRETRTKLDAVKSSLLESPLILSAAAAGNPIGNNDLGMRNFNLGADGNNAPDTKMVQELQVDEDFIPAMQISLIQGRNFRKGSSDAANGSIIVNETLVRELGWKDPVGKRVITGADDKHVLSYSTIVGVIRDFNSYSLQHKVSPMVLRLPTNVLEKDNLYVRLNASDIKAALTYLQKVYASYDGSDKVDYHFLDDNFANQYQTEEKQGSLLLLFTSLAIVIACLGLLGLVTFTAQQRVKEIGIRKVLGASMVSILALLSADLMKLVILATFIACPIAWFAMNKWLDGFAYRMNIAWWVFPLAGLSAIAIALITTVIRSGVAAKANPVKSLRSE